MYPLGKWGSAPSEDQLNRLMDMRNVCALNKFLVEDWQFASIMLAALPTKYQHITDALLNSKENDQITPDEVRAKILDQQTCNHQTASSANSNLLTMKKGSGSGPKNKKKGLNGPCYHCRQEGHWSKFCKQKKKP